MSKPYWEEKGRQAIDEHFLRPRSGDITSLTVYRRLRRLTRNSREERDLHRGFYGRMGEINRMPMDELDRFIASA